MDRSSESTPRRMRRRVFGMVGASCLLVGGSIVIPVARPLPVVAASELRLDVSPEDGTAAEGDIVDLSATVYDGAGNLALAGHTVRFYFMPGSANDPGGHGSNPDFTCDTGTAGSCVATYLAIASGQDVICAEVAGNPALCDAEAWADVELDNNADAVHRTIVAGGAATLTPTVSPTAAPTDTGAPTSDATATVGPMSTAGPTATATVAPTIEPASVDPTPTPSSSAEPTPTLTASASTDPTPTPDDLPSSPPTAEPTPTATASASESPSANPSATPSETPVDPATPSPTPTSRPTSTPAATPTATATMPADGFTPAPSNDPQPSASVSATIALVVPPPGDGTGGPTAGGQIGGATGGGDQTDHPGTDTRSLSSSDTPLLASLVHEGRGPLDFVAGFVQSVADQLGPTVKPSAAIAVAETFGFPLLLTLAVLLFLVVQSRLDGGDPKLRSAPLRMTDTVLSYVDEGPR